MKRQSTGFFQLAIIHLFSSFLTWILPCHGCRRPTCWTWRPTRGRWWRPPGGWEQAPLSSASSSKLLPSDTEDSGPWADGPWPPMAGELRWSLRRKQQCHPPLLPMLPQANPTHSHWLRIPFGDFWGFLGISWEPLKHCWQACECQCWSRPIQAAENRNRQATSFPANQASLDLLVMALCLVIKGGITWIQLPEANPNSEVTR